MGQPVSQERALDSSCMSVAPSNLFSAHFSPTLPPASFTLRVSPWSLVGVYPSLCLAPLVACILASILSAAQAASARSALTLLEKVSQRRVPV